MATNFSVTPMSQNLTLTPGETTEGKITVVNPMGSGGELRFRVEVVPFSMTADGQIDTETVGAYAQLAKWLSIEASEGMVAENKSAEVAFKIEVPAEAAGGSQAAAILVEPVEDETAGDNSTQVKSVFPIASIIYANVVGETRHETEIVKSELPSFALAPPVYATVELRNGGNTFETAEVTLTARNLVTGEVIVGASGSAEAGSSSGSSSSSSSSNVVAGASSQSGNTFTEVVMPENTRTVMRSIDGLPTVGVVRLEQTVEYGGETVTTTSDLVIFPVWLMVLIGIAIVAIVGGIWALVARKKRKRRMAI